MIKEHSENMIRLEFNMNRNMNFAKIQHCFAILPDFVATLYRFKMYILIQILNDKLSL